MTALMHAAQRGDSTEAERLLERGADVNAVVPTREMRELIAFLSWMQQLPKSDIGYTPLHYASANGDPGTVRLLIARGADVHRAADGGATPFAIAVSRSDLPTMEALAAAGARPTPKQLANAVSLSSAGAVGFLLAHGADPNVLPPRASYGEPPAPLIILAARRGDPAIIRLLLDAGADVNARDSNGWSALRWLRHTSSRGMPGGRTSEIVAMLEAGGATDEAGARADALFDAVSKKDVAAVRAALLGGASANSRDDRGVPPLIYAASSGVPEIVAALVESGANVNVSPNHDTTPLIAAITGGNIDVVKILLAAGARVDQADNIRRTPLEVASGWNRTEVTSLLLESSASVDPQALAIAALNGNADQVRMLLARDLDPNAGKGHALREAARGCQGRDNIEVIRLLLEAGADPRIHGESTALQGAAALCSPEVVRLLLDRGADPRTRDMNGITPLVDAVLSGRPEVVRMLIAAGADVNARDDDGKSVLQYAARYPAVQDELRRAGAS